MHLIDTIRTDSIVARKGGHKIAASLLVTLFAEAARVGKDNGNRASTDDEVIKTIQKFKKNAEDTLLLCREEAKETLRAEISILDRYLPKLLSEAELAMVIGEIVAGLAYKSPKQMGIVMAALKEKYAGRYDGKAASAAVKGALS